MPLKINDMINISEGKKRDILLELKKLNLLAYQNFFMMPYVRNFKAKYRVLQKTDLWRRGKELNIEYKLDGRKVLYCKKCGRKLTRNNCVLHHEKYLLFEIFLPSSCQIICNQCHKKIHNK